MPGPFLVHRIDPIIGTVFGIHLWWYGLSYSLGFLNAHLFLRRQRATLGLSLRSIYSLTLCLALGVLAGGRALVVFDHEWTFYREHLALIPAVWLGGMATHGLLAGGCLGVFGYCVWRRLPFRTIFDALAIPAALIMGFGRIGNFIDGQIVGSVTSVPWAIQFPEADGFRHPVVLYDGLKNFLLVPLLLWAGRRRLPPGRLAALFVVLYAGLRIPIDLLREYPVNPLGLPTGEGFNVIMLVCRAAAARTQLVAGAAGRTIAPSREDEPAAPPGWRLPLFIAILLASLVIASDATRDIPALYGHRHAGLEVLSNISTPALSHLQSPATMRYRFGDFEADRIAYKASRGGTALDLTPKLLDLLFYLLDRPGQLVTKEELLDAVWPGANVTENAMAQAISDLREAIGDEAASPTYIRTIARRGYRFIAPVQSIPAGQLDRIVRSDYRCGGRRKRPAGAGCDGLRQPVRRSRSRLARRRHRGNRDQRPRLTRSLPRRGSLARPRGRSPDRRHDARGGQRRWMPGSWSPEDFSAAGRIFESPRGSWTSSAAMCWQTPKSTDRLRTSSSFRTASCAYLRASSASRRRPAPRGSACAKRPAWTRIARTWRAG